MKDALRAIVRGADKDLTQEHEEQIINAMLDAYEKGVAEIKGQCGMFK